MDIPLIQTSPLSRGFVIPMSKESVIKCGPGTVNVLYLRKLLLGKPAFIVQFTRGPNEFAEPPVMMMKTLVGILPGLGGEEEKRPVAALHEEKLPRHLSQDTFPPRICRFDPGKYVLSFENTGVDVRPDPAVFPVLPDREIRV